MDSNLNPKIFEKFFDTAEENRDTWYKGIKSSLNLISLILLIIAFALCIIAFCQFYDFSIKYNAINSAKEVINDFNQYIN